MADDPKRMSEDSFPQPEPQVENRDENHPDWQDANSAQDEPTDEQEYTGRPSGGD